MVPPLSGIAFFRPRAPTGSSYSSSISVSAVARQKGPMATDMVAERRRRNRAEQQGTLLAEAGEAKGYERLNGLDNHDSMLPKNQGVDWGENPRFYKFRKKN